MRNDSNAAWSAVAARRRRRIISGVYGYSRLVELAETGTDPWGLDPDENPDWIDDWRPDQFDLETAKAAFDR